MEDCVRIIQKHYDSDVQKEWDRLERHPFEFTITTRMKCYFWKANKFLLMLF